MSPPRRARPVTGTIDSAGDRDWFRMPIISNERVYLMEVKGADTEDGTLTHSRITGVYDAHGNLLRYSGVAGQLDTENTAGLTPNNAAIMFTPPAKGTYFLEVAGDEGPPASTRSWCATSPIPPSQKYSAISPVSESKMTFWAFTATSPRASRPPAGLGAGR